MGEEGDASAAHLNAILSSELQAVLVSSWAVYFGPIIYEHFKDEGGLGGSIVDSMKFTWGLLSESGKAVGRVLSHMLDRGRKLVV